MKHLDIYRVEGGYGGWPANNGMWSWADEIVFGFNAGHLDTSFPGGHPIDGSKRTWRSQARSTDGGETWETIEAPHAPSPAPDAEPLAAGIDFAHPDFAMKVLCDGLHVGAKSWFYVSYDRCRTWKGPWPLPMMGLSAVAARTDYKVFSKDHMIAFLTTAKPDGYEGRAFCGQTFDGGQTWRFLSWIGPEMIGWSIMPATVVLPSGRILAAVRCNTKPERFIDLYASDDMGRSWIYLKRPKGHDGGGNPPAMIRLRDGRVCLTYGWRAAPFGIRARLSEDEGMTWGEEIILRDDGGCGDLGYTRTTQREDGKIVTVYYYNVAERGERFIGGTIWDPDEV